MTTEPQPPEPQPPEPEAPSSAGAEPRRGPGAGPPGTDRSDELLDAPPRGDHHLGRFAGYRDAAPVRRKIALALGACAILMVVTYWQAARHFEAEYERERYERLHPYELPAGTDIESRPRELTWSTGKARLGLRREIPGVAVIHLPDRDLVLAPGSDHAQLNVEVRDGEVVYLKILFGTVEERPPGSVRVDAPKP